MVLRFSLVNLVLVRLWVQLPSVWIFFLDFQKLFSLPIPLLSGIGNETIGFETMEELMQTLLDLDFDKYNNGIVILIDEIAVVFKELFYSPYGTDFFTFLTQMRKMGIYIIGTAQIYSKCDKTVRDYFRENGQVVFCFRVFPGITIQKFIDMDSVKEDSKNQLVYEHCKNKIFFHSPELYESYDTFKVIKQIKNIGKKGVTVYNGN